MMYNPESDNVEEHIKGELERLQLENESLKKWIKLGRDYPTCVVCGKPIKNASIQRLSRPLLWDSKECFLFKPRKIIALEQQYGMDIVEILKETTRKYGSIKSQCDALGVSIPYFYTIMDKYCGDRAIFMAKWADGKRKEIYKKELEKRKKRGVVS